VPLLTPLRAGGGLALDAIPACVERVLEAGVDGLVALGTTGEFADLTAAERASVAGAVVQAVGGRVPVLAGVGGVGTTEACEHARAATDAGADGVLVLPPLYWKLDGDPLVAHFSSVAGATTLPVLLYDFPSLSATPLEPALVARVVAEVPRVVGIKLSGPQLRVAHGIVARVKPGRPDFAVMMGAVDLVLPGLLGGADGTIAAIANVAPSAVVELVEAFEAGDLASAWRHHRRVLELLAIPALATPPVLALKAAAAACGAPLEPVVRTAPAGSDAVAARARGLAEALLGPG
jgi:4-hydroxy-tetrahydrodipicolinate synthase